MLKRFRIEDSDNDNEGETDGDEISKIGNNDDYMLSEELEEVSKLSLKRSVLNEPVEPSHNVSIIVGLLQRIPDCI